jgi:hypothetical protein
MEVLEFLKKYSNLSEGLNSLKKDFNIEHKILNDKLLLKYGRISDKSLKIVRECRGLILSTKTLEPVSVPFEKFGNYGEVYAPTDMDITKCKTMEKLDGTCIGLYWDFTSDKWHVQTLKQVEAEEIVKSFSREQDSSFTWASLFWTVFKQYAELSVLEKFDKDFTYMFELCTPWNRVVVPHKEPKLFFTGLRNKTTFKEEWPESSLLYNIFDKPKIYSYNDIDEIVKIAQEQLGSTDEGFILVDENFRRVKIKSKQYVEQHYDSTVITINNIVGIVLQNEQDEWLINFPEYIDVVEVIKDEINIVGKKIDDYYVEMSAKLKYKDNAKELALLLKKEPKGNNGLARSYIFQLQRGVVKSGKEAITFFRTRADMIHKVNILLENTNISKRVEFNINNGSLRG